MNENEDSNILSEDNFTLKKYYVIMLTYYTKLYIY